MKGLVFFCILGAAYALPDDVCSRSASEVCKSEYPPPRGMPRTEEELKNVCGYISDIMLCIKEFVDKCGTLNADLFRGLVLADKIENVIEVTKVLCKKDSKTYRVVVKHLPCIREVTDEFNYCNLKRNNTIKLLQEHLGSREMMPFQHVTRCLPTVLDSNCYVGRFDKKCGSDLKDVALAAIDKMDMLTSDCPKTLHPEFLIMLELVEKLTKEVIYVKSTFQ